MFLKVKLIDAYMFEFGTLNDEKPVIERRSPFSFLFRWNIHTFVLCFFFMFLLI